MRPSVVWASALLLALLPGFGAAAASQPVWTAPALGLAPGESVSAALTAPFPDDIPAHISANGGTKTTSLHDCRDYLAQQTRITGSENEQAWRVLQAAGVRCQALDLIARAHAAERSFVSGFQFTPETVRHLPASVAFAVSPDEEEKLHSASEHHETLAQILPHVRTRIVDGDAADLLTKSWNEKLTLYGRGDFNGDGLQDLLVRRDVFARAGTLATSDLILLTRTGPDQPISSVAMPRN